MISGSSKQKKKIEYYIYPNPVKHHGIKNKIEQTVLALNLSGYNADIVTVDSGLKGLFSLIKKLAYTKAEIVIFRNTFLMPFFIPSVITARLNGTKVIVDLPTPITNVLKEFITRNHIGEVSKAVRIMMVAITYPWVFIPFNKILQYAPESKYFSFFIKHKTVRVANGINVDTFPIKKNIGKWSGSKLTIVAVANMASWHGFDRVIKGIANYTRHKNNRVIVKFIIVGEGQYKEIWEKLSIELNVSEYVDFIGFKKSKQLDAIFDNSNIAVSSLALFRIQIEEASVLKSREYTARGIPFIASGLDIDFDSNTEFVYKVDNNEGEINISELIEWYKKLILTSSSLNEQIREYAISKLDFRVKLDDFLPR